MGAADEHATLASGELFRGISGVLHAVPAALQENALLRVHRFGLDRRQAEEQRIELVVPFQHAHPLRIALAKAGLAFDVVRAGVPARQRDFADAVAAAGDVVPEAVDIFRHRETAGHADDGNLGSMHAERLDGLRRRCGTRHVTVVAPRFQHGPVVQHHRLSASDSKGHRRRSRGLRRWRCEDRWRGRIRSSVLRKRIAHEAGELLHRRIGIDPGRFDGGAVVLVDGADPGDAGNRVEPQFDEAAVGIDAFWRLSQFQRQQIDEGATHGA